MGEPIRLYGPDGHEVTVYGKAQAAVLAAKGYNLTPPEPGPEVEVIVTDDPAPVEPPKRTAVKRSKGKE